MSQNSSESSLPEQTAEQAADRSQSSAPTESSIASSPASSLQSLSLTTSVDEKNTKFKITLDSPTHEYYSGSVIRGTVSLFCKHRKKIRGIYFRVIGYGKCGWTDWLRRESVSVDSKAERSFVQYSGTEEYINSTMYIVGSKDGQSFVLLPGSTTYDFQFNLKTDLPSSFSGSCGKIKYKLEFVVDKPWKFDEKQTLLLNIIQRVNLNSAFSTLQPFENQLTRNIGYINCGPISVHVFIPKTGYICGERLAVQVIVSNNSRIHVEKVKFALNKIIDYHSKSPGEAIKREIQRLLKKEAGGVAKKTEQRYEHVIDMPMTTPSQDSSTSRLIYISYELIVETKLGGLYKNLLIAVPLKIGTHSINNHLQNAIFPALPELPAGLSVHTPSTSSLQPRRSSMTSISSFRSNLSHNSHNIQASQSDRSTNIDSSEHITTTADSSISSNNSSFGLAHATGSNDYRPTAPHMDQIGRSIAYADAPPSYDEVFGSAFTNLDQSSFSISSPIHSASTSKSGNK